MENQISIITFVLYKLINTKNQDMDDHFMIDELLYAWEETYKKGQLTFWIFFALKEDSRCVEDIKEFVEKAYTKYCDSYDFVVKTQIKL